MNQLMLNPRHRHKLQCSKSFKPVWLLQSTHTMHNIWIPSLSIFFCWLETVRFDAHWVTMAQLHTHTPHGCTCNHLTTLIIQFRFRGKSMDDNRSSWFQPSVLII